MSGSEFLFLASLNRTVWSFYFFIFHFIIFFSIAVFHNNITLASLGNNLGPPWNHPNITAVMYRDSLNGRPLIGSPIMSGGVSLLENRIKKRFSFVVGDFLCSNIKNTLYIYSHCNLVGLKHIHTENFFLKNLIKETRNQIVFTVFR